MMNKAWSFMIVPIFIHGIAGLLTIADAILRDDLNYTVTIVTYPKLGEGRVCINQSINLTCYADDQQKHYITWYWSDQSKEGATLIVQATQYEVVYTCKVSNNNGLLGEANITVAANGTPPVMSTNFRYVISRCDGSNVTLITIITSDPPLSGYPAWNVNSGIDHDLPPNSIINNTMVDGVLNNTLYLFNLSYNDDTGNYTCIASNQCGNSSVFTYIEVDSIDDCIDCNNLGKITESFQDIITAPGEYIQFRCLVQGNLDSLGFSLTNYWKMDFPPYQNLNTTYIIDNSTYPYRIALYPNCEACCNFTTQLTILSVPPQLNGTITFTCVEHIELVGGAVTQDSNSTLNVLVNPKIISSSSNEICATVNKSVSLPCKFSTSTMEGATIVVWLKDQSEITGYDNEIRPVQGKDNVLVSILNMKRFKLKDQGEYICYCYYNQSMVKSDKPISSGNTTFNVHINCPATESKEKNTLWVIIGSVVGSIVAVIIAIILLILGVKVVLVVRSNHHGPSISNATEECNQNGQQENSYDELTSCIYYEQPASYGATDTAHHHERQANNRDRPGSNHDRANDQQGNSRDELISCSHGPPATSGANTTHNHKAQANNGIKSDAAYGFNSEITPSAAQLGTPQSQINQYNIINVNQLHLTSESALHKPEEILPDTFANPLRQHASDFKNLVNITTLAPVLFENDLLTSHDMEHLQLPTITDSDKINYVYLKLLRCGEEGYEKFMKCLKDPNAMSHRGHIELYEKLSTLQC